MMQVRQSLAEFTGPTEPVILAAGMFDGVHVGHQAVIRAALSAARELHGAAWVLTLEPHPLKILNPRQAPPLLTSTHHKLRLFESLGVQGCLILPFTQERAHEEPEAFIADMRAAIPGLKAMVVGLNWTFGRRGRGTSNLLRQWAADMAFDVHIVAPILADDEPVSSTRVRKSVMEGDLDKATALLGRPFSVLGDVIAGKRFGRTMGFPTANVDPHNEVQPPAGVYAARLTVDGNTYDGAAFRPDGGPAVDLTEIHLFDFSGDLYGREVEVHFIRRTRLPQTFPDTDHLRNQIALDVEAIRDYFKRSTKKI